MRHGTMQNILSIWVAWVGSGGMMWSLTAVTQKKHYSDYGSSAPDANFDVTVWRRIVRMLVK